MDYQQTIIRFIEGRIPFEEFQNLVMNDDDFAEWIDRCAPKDWQCYTKATAENDYKCEPLPFSIRHRFYELSCQETLNSAGYKYGVHGQMLAFAKEVWPDVELHPDETFAKQFDLLLTACPSYIDGEYLWRSGLMEQLLAECPEEWSKTRKAKHIRARLMEEFHLEDKRYPRWLQNPEWPFSNGKPMKYTKTTVKCKGEWVQHHFIDLETGEERIVDDAH